MNQYTKNGLMRIIHNILQYQAVGLEEPEFGICGSTEFVNGICQVIQTEEKLSNGGGCLIATAAFEMAASTTAQRNS